MTVIVSLSISDEEWLDGQQRVNISLQLYINSSRH